MSKIYPGPFTRPIIEVTNHLPQRSIENAKDRPLKERIAFLARVKHLLTSCENINGLMRKIDELAKRYLQPVGELVYLAFLGPRGELTALTYPEEPSPPQRSYASGPSLFVSRNQAPTFPIKPGLIQAAISSGDIHREEEGNKEYLAVPLVDPHRSQALGVLLIVNNFSTAKEKITQNDIKVTRTFAEFASEEIIRLTPPPPPPIFTNPFWKN